MKSFSDFPKVIEIQFQNRCNSNCLICPYKDMNYSYQSMDEKLFKKIMSEIDDNKLTRLIPYLNNEPFLDPNYIEKLKYIRKNHPNIEIEISSNVMAIKKSDLLTLSELNITELRLSVFGYTDETYKKMMPGLNKKIVFEKLKLISNILKNDDIIISIVMIDNNEIDENEFTKMKNLSDELGFKFERWGYLDRSNNVKYKSNNINNNNVCSCEQNRPIERMHILANGDVISCCQDWKHTIILGNLTEKTIYEIWNGKEYINFRDSLYNKEKKSPDICIKCKLAH